MYNFQIYLLTFTYKNNILVLQIRTRHRGGDKVKRVKIRIDEVLHYIEEKIIDNAATTKEQQLFEDILWSDDPLEEVNKHTYAGLISEMRDIVEGN